MQRDENLLRALDGGSPYAIYTVRGIDHRLQLTWMWCWPWETTAKAEFIERIPRIDGRINRQYEETAIRLYGEDQYESPPRWQGCALYGDTGQRTRPVAYPNNTGQGIAGRLKKHPAQAGCFFYFAFS